MSNYQEYINQVIPAEWLPKPLAEIKEWTFGELANDRTTRWTGTDGKRFVMARQLLHIWAGTDPQKISDLPEDQQQPALLRQQIAMAMFALYPSLSKEKQKKKSISKTA